MVALLIVIGGDLDKLRVIELRHGSRGAGDRNVVELAVKGCLSDLLLAYVVVAVEGEILKLCPVR